MSHIIIIIIIIIIIMNYYELFTQDCLFSTRILLSEGPALCCENPRHMSGADPKYQIEPSITIFYGAVAEW